MVFYLKLLGMMVYALGVSTLEFLLLPFLFWNPNLFAPWVRRLSWGMRFFSGIRTEIRHPERLSADPPAVLMGNHQSAMDMATFGRYIPDRTTGIGKQEILFIPIIGWMFLLTGGILLNRKDRKSSVRRLEVALAHLRKGKNVAILPEGTRNPEGDGLLPFKKGGFHLAIQAQRPIVPVVCGSLRHIAHFETRTLRPGRVILEALEPISTRGMTADDVDTLMATTRARMEEAFRRLNEEMEVPPR